MEIFFTKPKITTKNSIVCNVISRSINDDCIEMKVFYEFSFLLLIGNVPYETMFKKYNKKATALAKQNIIITDQSNPSMSGILAQADHPLCLRPCHARAIRYLISTVSVICYG